MVINWWRWALSLLTLFILSYVRETIFLSINAYIDGQTTFYAKTMEIPFLANYTVSELVRLKYFLTIISTIIFCLVTSFGLYFSFKNKIAYKLSLLIYASVLIVVILLFTSLLFTSFSTIFNYLRELAHLTHNALLFLILSITGYSLEFKTQTIKN